MDDVPIRGVIPDDCRVGRKDLGVGKVRAHVVVCRIFVALFYLFNGKFTGISKSKINRNWVDIGLTQGPSWATKRDAFDLVGSGERRREDGGPSSGIGGCRDTGTQGGKGVGEWWIWWCGWSLVLSKGGRDDWQVFLLTVVVS